MKKILVFLYLFSIYTTIALLILVKFQIVKISYLLLFFVLSVTYFIRNMGDWYGFFKLYSEWNEEEQKKHKRQMISGSIILCGMLFGIIFCTVIDPEWGAEIATF